MVGRSDRWACARGRAGCFQRFTFTPTFSAVKDGRRAAADADGLDDAAHYAGHVCELGGQAGQAVRSREFAAAFGSRRLAGVVSLG